MRRALRAVRRASVVSLAATSLAIAACQPDATAPTASPTSSQAPLADDDAIAAALPSALPGPTKLARRVTPTALAERDLAACTAGKVDACRRAADRRRGTGAVAGCGVDRGRKPPTLKVTPRDAEPDRRAFLDLVARACTLGDAGACALAKRAPETYRTPHSFEVRYGALRADPSGLGVFVFRSKTRPEWGKVLADSHARCMKEGSWSCGADSLVLFRKEKLAEGGKLPPERRALAEEVCRDTHDCDDVYMMLDREGYSPAELAPLRDAFAATLIEACLDGECTCGSATTYLPANDERLVDLAAMGCENGEAEACFALGRAYERGEGVPRDEARGRALHDLACPPTRAEESSGIPRGEYSAHACDRLAEIAIGPSWPAEDWERAMYYATGACPAPGFSVDHAPCIRLGMLYIHNPVSSGRNGEDARDAAWGRHGDPINRNECRRGSVVEACAAFEKALPLVR